MEEDLFVCRDCGAKWSRKDSKRTTVAHLPICPACGTVQYGADTAASSSSDYTPLTDVLHDALERARSGKGKERHAEESQDFLQQPIFAIPRALGGGSEPLLFQAVKKIYESRRLSKEASRNELLDAIVYIAAAVLLEDERCAS